jgi:ribosomal protein S18 acetylase RimI-like enzyme
MEIVKLPVEDWKQYRDLRLRALKEDQQAFSSVYADALKLPEERWTGRLREALNGQASWLFFARENGRLVGMIGAFVEETSPDAAIIVSVYVPVEERGKGISNALMDCILRELSGRPDLKTATLTVNKTQLPAIALYEKYGFRRVQERPGATDDGCPVVEIVMERPLPYPPQVE